MNKILRVLMITIVFILLTIMTQIGGVIFLLSFLLHRTIERRSIKVSVQVLFKVIAFLVLYVFFTFTIVPWAAKPFGRVPLPYSATKGLKPLNFITCLLNRNYVRPTLKEAAFQVSQSMESRFPGTVINYLDASFPFFNGLPLFPHLSHNDGKKLDLSFCYLDKATALPTNQCPSFIGYGICEEPLPGERNTAEFCAGNGYFQYSFLRKVVPQSNKQNYLLDNERTKALVVLFATQPLITKIFIEPHLKTRLQLTTAKIRFHGCQAVRHDDHIHVQL